MIKQSNEGYKKSGLFKRLGVFLSKAPVAITLFCVLILVLASVNLLDFPLSVPYMRRISGNNYLDMHMLYSVDQAYFLLDAFGAEGRRLQLLLLPTIDIVIPTLSGIAGFSMIAYLFKNASGETVLLGKFRHVALVASVTDFLENSGIFTMVVLYPERLDIIAGATGILTAVKFVLYLLTFLLILAGIAYRLYPGNRSGYQYGQEKLR